MQVKIPNSLLRLFLLALDPAEASKLNKILHDRLQDVDAEYAIDMRSDPRSPLYSNQTFEGLNL